MAVPTPRTPIPAAARPIIEAVHRRHAAECGDPRNVPLTAQERVTLAKCGYYPIPQVVIQLGRTPEEHRREQLQDLIRDTLARDMPEVFDILAQERRLLP